MASTDDLINAREAEELCHTRPAVTIISAAFPSDVLPRLVLQRVVAPFTPHAAIDAPVGHVIMSHHHRAVNRHVTRWVRAVFERFGGPPIESAASDTTDHLRDGQRGRDDEPEGDEEEEEEAWIPSWVQEAGELAPMTLPAARFPDEPGEADDGASERAAPHLTASDDAMTSLTFASLWPPDVKLALYARNLTTLTLVVTQWTVGSFHAASFIDGTRNVRHFTLDTGTSMIDFMPAAREAIRTIIHRCVSFCLIGRINALLTLLTSASDFHSLMKVDSVSHAHTVLSGTHRSGSLGEMSMEELMAETAAELLPFGINMAAFVSLRNLTSFTWRCPKTAKDRDPLKAKAGGLSLAAILLATNLGGPALRRLTIQPEHFINFVPWPAVRRVLRRSPNLEELTLTHFEPSLLNDRDDPRTSVFGAVPMDAFVDVLRSLTYLRRLNLRHSSTAVTGLSDEHVAKLLFPSTWTCPSPEPSSTDSCSGFMGGLCAGMTDDEVISHVKSILQASGGAGPLNDVPLPNLVSLDLSGHCGMTCRVLSFFKARAALSALVPLRHTPPPQSVLQWNTSEGPSVPVPPLPQPPMVFSKGKAARLESVSVAKVWVALKAEAQRCAATSSIPLKISV